MRLQMGVLGVAHTRLFSFSHNATLGHQPYVMEARSDQDDELAARELAFNRDSTSV